MRTYIWLSFAEEPWLEFAEDDKGTLSISRIAARIGIRGESVTVREVGLFEGITIEDLRSVLGPTAGMARESALPVHGTALPLGSADFEDRSGEWIKYMLLPRLLELPWNEYDLENMLFPKVPGKLPVLKESYGVFRLRHPGIAEKFLMEGDGSKLPIHLTATLLKHFGQPISEMYVSVFIADSFMQIFRLWDKHGPDTFVYKMLFNCNDKTGGSNSGSTTERSRPDTLVTASGCTFLVGEDKFSSVSDAEEDLRKKILPLSSMFYGELECILGYVAGGSEFQWVCINKSGGVKKVGRSLDLLSKSHRCEFLLSIGYAYQLIKKMVDSVPDVPGRRAVFTREIVGDREIAFYPGYVRKTIKNFQSFCYVHRTQLDWILEAYRLGETCHFLPRIRPVRGTYIHHFSYRVEIVPIGFTPILRTEHDTRMLAKSVCEALRVLHAAGFVHRDIREPNILQVSKEQFMLIDLETVVKFPFPVPPGFERFNEWSDDTLVDSVYTPMSDLYQLGKLLRHKVPSYTTSSTSAQQFIRMLQSKRFTAAMALNDPWLSNPTSESQSQW